MLQKDLAKILDISPAMVSKLKKLGMPTDDPVRAQRWRKRHLEPGRIKGSRFDPTQKAQPPAPMAATLAPVADSGLVTELLAEIEAAGTELDRALSEGDDEWVAVMMQQVRDLLRMLPDGAWPNMTLPVWQVLTAEIQALYPPREGNPLCEDGSPVYVDNLTDEEAFESGRFWLEVAAGRWTVNPAWQAKTL